MLYNRIGSNSQLVLHNRFSGWVGHTYSEALEFCNLKESKNLCPYENLCSNGIGEELSIIKFMDGPVWMPMNGKADTWVEIRDQGQCAVQTKLDKLQDVTRYVLCCETIGEALSDVDNGDISIIDVPAPKSVEPPTSLPQPSPAKASLQEGAEDLDLIFNVEEKKFHPVAFTRSQGWSGSTYGEALKFCALQKSSIPCPYEAICPMASRGPPVGGVVGVSTSAWAPIMDSPNGWVQIGDKDTCMKFTDVNPHPPLWGLGGKEGEAFTPHILCCEEPEDGHPQDEKSEEIGQLNKVETIIVSSLHPVWFGREHGYHGTTHEEAELFCRSVGTMNLCPIDAHCPNGPRDSKALYLQKDAFEDEQWAPTSSYDNEDASVRNSWVMIGKKDNNPYSTCLEYGEVYHGKSAPWNADGGMTELKEHILCCVNRQSMVVEKDIEMEKNSVWLDASHGWSGGSYDDGVEFCQKLGGKKLCPFSAYCPHGPGMQPMGGHSADFNLEGEQWAPFEEGDGKNNWVLVGRKYGNSATTCYSHKQLEGSSPAWGLSGEKASFKRHIQCCSF